MEWTNNMILKLIDAYRQRPVLWNYADEQYKHRNKKEEAWLELANMFDTETSEIKKKFQSLQASYRKERQKLQNPSKMGVPKDYVPKWFAFKSMLFLREREDAEGWTRLIPIYECCPRSIRPDAHSSRSQGEKRSSHMRKFNQIREPETIIKTEDDEYEEEDEQQLEEKNVIEWTNSNVLKLIDAYRQRPVLWNYADEEYKYRHKKEEAWLELSNIFETDVTEIKKKFQSLQASYRKERQKSKLGAGKNYVSKWFAYKSMLFLKDRGDPDGWLRHIQEPETIIKTDDENEDHEEEPPKEKEVCDRVTRKQRRENNNETKSNTFEPTTKRHRCEGANDTSATDVTQNKKKQTDIVNKRLCLENSNDTTSVFEQSVRKEVELEENKDDIDIFSSGVAAKLRQLKCHRLKLLVQRDIDNLLYDALLGMGKYTDS